METRGRKLQYPWNEPGPHFIPALTSREKIIIRASAWQYATYHGLEFDIQTRKNGVAVRRVE